MTTPREQLQAGVQGILPLLRMNDLGPAADELQKLLEACQADPYGLDELSRREQHQQTTEAALVEARNDVKRLSAHLRWKELEAINYRKIITELCDAPVKQPHLRHVGLSAHRCDYDGRPVPDGEVNTYVNAEKIFADTWREENTKRAGRNMGLTVLEVILSPGVGTDSWVAPITQRDATVAASVIQWLGTNCGQGFLFAVDRTIKQREALLRKLSSEQRAARKTTETV